MTPSSSRWYSVVHKGVISSMWKSAVQCLGNRSPDPLTIPTDVHRQLMCIGKWYCIIRKQSCVLCRKVLLKTKCFIPPPTETFRAAGILLSGLTCPVHPWVSLWVCATRRTLWTPYQSINQSINHLFVLSSTRNKYNVQYSVEQDTKAWSTYRCPKLSLIIKTHKKSLNNEMVRRRWLGLMI